MKKLFLLILAFISVMLAPDVNADVTLGGSDRISFSCSGSTFLPGDVIPGSPSTIILSCEEGYILGSVTVNGNEVYNYETADRAQNSYWYESYKFSEPIESFSATTIRYADKATESFTIKSPADFWFLGWEKTFSNIGRMSHHVEEGETVVEFIPGRDKFGINPIYYMDFYQVTHNGVPVNLRPGHDTNYTYLDIKDGDVIEVVTPVPDKMCHVNIVSPNGETGFIEKAWYKVSDPSNGRWIRTYVDTPESFDAPAGSIVSFDWNYEDFKEPTVGYANGTEFEIGFDDDNDTPVDRDIVTISIPADRYPLAQMTFDIDDASKVTVYTGAYTPNSEIEVHDGLQTVTFPEHHYVYLMPKSTGEVESITFNDRELSTSYSYGIPVNIMLDYSLTRDIVNGKESGVIYVTTKERVRDIPVKMFVNDLNVGMQLRTESYVDSHSFEVNDGENALLLSKDDFRKLQLVFDEDVYDVVKVLSTPMGQNWYQDNLCQLQYNDNIEYAVIRVYGNGSPSYHKVTVTAELDDNDYELRSDYHTLLSGKSHFLPEGTLFHVNTFNGKASEVYVNGEKLNSASPFSHSFAVTGPSEVEIKMSTTGVDDIINSPEDDVTVYYNLQGVRVDNPSNGIFIVVKNGIPTCQYIK